MICITSFHGQASTMIFNKRNVCSWKQLLLSSLYLESMLKHHAGLHQKKMSILTFSVGGYNVNSTWRKYVELRNSVAFTLILYLKVAWRRVVWRGSSEVINRNLASMFRVLPILQQMMVEYQWMWIMNKLQWISCGVKYRESSIWWTQLCYHFKYIWCWRRPRLVIILQEFFIQWGTSGSSEILLPFQYVSSK